MGCGVHQASSGTDAIHQLIDHIFGLNVFVVGRSFPDLSSLDLLDRVRMSGGETALPVVVLEDASTAPGASIRQMKATAWIAEATPVGEMARRIFAVAETPLDAT